jgi:molybdopterin molybdotransferase
VLANDVISSIDVPAHDNSAMDGYAFAGAMLNQGDGDVVAGSHRHRVCGNAFDGEAKADRPCAS